MTKNLKPIPSAAQIKEMEQSFSIRTLRDPKGTLDLRYGVWYQGQGKPKQYIVFANGRTEWIEKYAYLPYDLGLGKDQAFVTWDHRGQGASGGARAHSEDYIDFAEAAAKVIEVATEGQPYVAFTHSMGGLIMLSAIMRGLTKPKALLMSSPLLGLPNRPVPRVIAQPLASFIKKLGLGSVSIPAVGEFEKSPFEGNVLTSSVELFERLKASPFPCPAPTFGWLESTFRAMAFVSEDRNIENYSVPTEVMVGGEEAVVDIKGIQRWVAKVKRHGKVSVDIKVIKGARHELFSESPHHYQEVMTTVKSWLSRQI